MNQKIEGFFTICKARGLTGKVLDNSGPTGLYQSEHALRSLAVLATLHALDAGLKTKSGVMVGLGETDEELFALFADLRQAGCTYLSVGQYLAPSRKHFPVQAFIEPARFDLYREKAAELRAARTGFELALHALDSRTGTTSATTTATSRTSGSTASP